MKFRIRFADQIVGFFIIAALVSIVFVVFMLGKSQRWFANDKIFVTQFSSAAGLSKNMPVLFMCFVIGNVQSFSLNEYNNVDVEFLIFDTYLDRVKLGSIVQLSVSPIGLGNQFLFLAGNGNTLLDNGDFIPAAGTPEAQDLVLRGLTEETSSDSISVLLGQVGSLLAILDGALTGTDETALGQIVGGTNRMVAELPDMLNRTLDEVNTMLDSINPIIANVNVLMEQLAAPDGTVQGILDGNGPVYSSLVDSLGSISGILDNLDQTTVFLPSQLPQIAGLLVDLRVTLKAAEDVLVALTNNPLLKKGIPERVDVQSSGTSPRNIRF